MTEETDRVTVAVTLTEAPGRGWVAHAAEARATAQGSTVEDAIENLRQLFRAHPDLLDELREYPPGRVELVAV